VDTNHISGTAVMFATDHDGENMKSERFLEVEWRRD